LQFSLQAASPETFGYTLVFLTKHFVCVDKHEEATPGMLVLTERSRYWVGSRTVMNSDGRPFWTVSLLQGRLFPQFMGHTVSCTCGNTSFYSKQEVYMQFLLLRMRS
jgi:hypothetical protein